MSRCGLHRRLRGAIVGHLAVFEMTSSVPNRRYATGLRRLGLGEDATTFFDVHVLADAVHESVAAVDLAGGRGPRRAAACRRRHLGRPRAARTRRVLGRTCAGVLGVRDELAARAEGERGVTLSERFEAVAPLTVGIEEEVMLLDPETLDLAPVAAEVLRRNRHGAPLKLELPASQVEIVTAPAFRVGDALVELATGRRALVRAADGFALPAAAGAHPFAAPLGQLNDGSRYDAMLVEYGDVARSQLVCALQIHVAVGGAERTLAVYNALRGHVPELAALAANAPFLAGRDTGMASVRPLISGLLPRQGVPPAFATWESLESSFSWGERSGAVPEPRRWWWELRPHPEHGTLELRVPDAQTTLADVAAVAAYAHALVAWLSCRHAAGERLAVDDTWRIERNRFRALRFGLEAELSDLETGERTPARELLHARLRDLAPVARELGCEGELAGVGALIDANARPVQWVVRRDEHESSAGSDRLSGCSRR
jgi:carboxylate-amine ligase